MALTHAYLRSFASLDLELEQILVRVNRHAGPGPRTWSFRYAGAGLP